MGRRLPASAYVAAPAPLSESAVQLSQLSQLSVMLKPSRVV